MNIDLLRDAVVLFIPAVRDLALKVQTAPPAFEVRLQTGRRIMYLPTAQSICLLRKGITRPAETLAADLSSVRTLSDEILTPHSREYIAVIEVINTALWQSRALGFTYTEDFFAGYYLSLRMWQTLMMQLELRMKVLNDENLFWLSGIVKPQFDSGKIDIPREAPISAFGSFMIPMPATPHLNAAEVRLGSSYGQWRSLQQLIALLADRGFRLITWEFIIDYCFECRHELAEMIEDKGMSFRKVIQIGDSVIREAGRI